MTLTLNMYIDQRAATYYLVCLGLTEMKFDEQHIKNLPTYQ